MSTAAFKWIAPGCVVLSMLGWSAIIVVAKLYPGGHPPLVAYLLLPVAFVLLPINIVGLVLSVRSWMRHTGRVDKAVTAISVLGNAVSLAIGGYFLLGF